MVDSSTSSGGKSGPDLYFLALAEDHRRHVLWYFLIGDEDVASLRDLAEYAAGRACGERSSSLLERKFHHVTLPKLAELDAVEYDPGTRTVRYRGSETLERAILALEELDPLPGADPRKPDGPGGPNPEQTRE